MKLNKLAKNLALVGLCSQFAAVALAQQTATPSTGAPAEKIERVEVTGSSIKRVKDEDALPLEVITSTQIRNMGINSTDALLRQIGANVASASSTVSSNTVFSTEGDRLGGGGNYAQGGNQLTPSHAMPVEEHQGGVDAGENKLRHDAR